MTQRFTLDRSSFEQFLAAASLLQQFQKRAFEDRATAQPLWELVDLQRGIDTGALDVNAVVQHVPRLAWELVGGTGAGVWLFNSEDEFVWRAGTGPSQHDERLRWEVLSRLVASEGGPEAERDPSHNWDAGYYPGCAKSLLVEPIRLDEDVAGAVAVFATEFDAFTDRDESKVRLLASLLGYALQRSAKVGKQEASALLPGEVREVMKREIPRLQDLAEYPEEERHALPHESYDGEDAQADDIMSEAEEPLFAYSTAQEPLEELSPSQQRQEVESGEPSVEAIPPVSLADIYVPGIGVRAALGDQEEERRPSRFWTGLRSSVAGVSAAIFSILALLFRALRSAAVVVASSIVDLGRGTRRGVARTVRYRPTLPTLPTASIRSQLQHIQSRCRTGIRAAGSSLRTVSHRVPRPVFHRPTVPVEALQQRVRSLGAWTIKSIDVTRRSLRQVRGAVPSIPAIRSAKVAATLRTAGSAASRTLVHSAKSVGKEVAQLRFRQAWRWTLNTRYVRRGAPAIIVLAVMLAFLFAQAGFHRNVQVASASTTASVPHAEAVPATPKLAPTSSPVSPLANSPTHHHITDPEARADVENMTRYEIATVRRAAQYGDDVAAFQLGMAYEIGYGMTQNCQKAAEWVTRAANDGNPAAEYNLGLRYRDGDGVAANSTEAEKWLKKAAERKYGNASALLASVSQGN